MGLTNRYSFISMYTVEESFSKLSKYCCINKNIEKCIVSHKLHCIYMTYNYVSGIMY